MIHRIKYIAAAGWMAAVTYLYFRLFPPVALLPSFGDIRLAPEYALFLKLVSLPLIIVAANGWGNVFWRAHELSPIERFVFATASGFGCIIIFVLTGDVIGLVSPLYYAVVIAAGCILFIASLSHLRGARVGRHFLLLAAGGAIPLALTLIAAMAPPVQFDSLVYHLAIPSQYISAGRMVRVPDNIFFAFPQNMEMLFQFGMVLNGDILANLIGWSFLFLNGAGIFALVRRYHRVQTAFFAALLWFFAPNVLFLATGTYVDLGLALYVLLSVHAYLLWKEKDAPRWIAAAGIFGGLALGVKYTAAVPVALVAAMVLFSGKEKAYRAALLYGFFALVAFSPWLIKNAVLLGNPVAPWGTALFRGSAITGEQARRYFSHIYGHGMGIDSLRDLLLLPWHLTVAGFRFGGGFDLPGPLFIIFMPLLFLRTEIDRISKIIVIFSAGFCLLWLLSGKVLRFLVPVQPFLCILSAQGVGLWSEKRWVLRAPAYMLLALILAHNILLFNWIETIVDPYSTVIGGEDRRHYLGRKLNGYRAVDECVNRLPEGSKVLFVGETRRYYTTAAAVVPTDFDVQPLAAWANGAASDAALRQALRGAGITHVLVNDYEYRRLGVVRAFTAEGKARWEGFRERSCRVVYGDAYCRVYEINY